MEGNPIEIAAVAVIKVIDSAKAIFDVDNYEKFVEIQSETALRHVATRYPYDNLEEQGCSLRGNTEEIAAEIARELQERLNLAGVEVIEARLTHLAYATEIASAMLQRQQASAIISARQKIVEGAVGMAQMAIERLQRDNTVELDEERKVAMINNLLVAIVSDRAAQPVINTGSLYWQVKGMAAKKSFPLRIDAQLFNVIEHWAADELRSVNAQIEFLLRESARKAGRLAKDKDKNGANPDNKQE